MTDYDTIIEEASEMIFHHLLTRSGDLVEDCHDIDRIVLAVTRDIGRLATRKALATVSERVVEPYLRRGLGVDSRRFITITTLFGRIEMASPYLRNRVSGQTARPVHDELGLRDGSRLPAVERALTDFGAERSFGRAAVQFEEHYGFTMGRTTILRVVENRARQTEIYLDQRLRDGGAAYQQPLATRPGSETLLIELDGCEIRTGRLEAGDGKEVSAVRKLPCRKRIEQWREVRVGFARGMEEVERTFVAKMADYPTICTDLYNAAVIRGLSSTTTVVAISDGGNGLKEELGVHFPGLVYLLDLPHLRSQLYETAGALGLEKEDQAVWVGERVDELWAGRTDRVLTRLHALHEEGSDRARQLAGYITRFSDAFGYAHAKEQGWPLGSGEVESAHRYIPQERLKLPGAWWLPETINPMLALRVIRANGWWDDFWEHDRQRRRAA